MAYKKQLDSELKTQTGKFYKNKKMSQSNWMKVRFKIDMANINHLEIQKQKNFRVKLKWKYYLKHQKSLCSKINTSLIKQKNQQRLCSRNYINHHKKQKTNWNKQVFKLNNKFRQHHFLLTRINQILWKQEMKPQFKITSKFKLNKSQRNNFIKEEQNAICAINNTIQSTVTNQTKSKKRINKIFLKNYLGYIPRKAGKYMKTNFQFKSQFLEKEQLGKLHAIQNLFRILKDGALMNATPPTQVQQEYQQINGDKLIEQVRWLTTKALTKRFNFNFSIYFLLFSIKFNHLK